MKDQVFYITPFLTSMAGVEKSAGGSALASRSPGELLEIHGGSQKVHWGWNSYHKFTRVLGKSCRRLTSFKTNIAAKMFVFGKRGDEEAKLGFFEI